jgi:hypothetical protein
MFLPWSENITTMVKRSEMSVSGLMAGTNRVSYHPGLRHQASDLT